jgi:hypothetical protein
VSLLGCQTPFNRSVALDSPLSAATGQGRVSARSRSEPKQPQQLGCSFEMIRASFQQVWASGGSFRYTWTTMHEKPACTEQGLLVSVSSAVKARAVPAAHESTRSACQRVPIGSGPLPHAHCTESDHAQHHWSPTGWDRPSTAGAQARMQPAFLLWLRDQPTNGH